MGNELTVKNDSLAELSSSVGLGELIKTLVKEIFLFDTYIAGTSHLNDKTVLDEIEVGEKLVLQREDNKFDCKAILILKDDKRKLGYVPERDNAVFSRLMDAGKLLTAKISSIEVLGTFYKIKVEIFLVDF